MNSTKVIFICLTSLQIPSFVCAIRVLFQYGQLTSPLRRLQNHLIMCLLIVATWTISVDLANTQVYFWRDSVTIHTYWFCSLWNISFFSTATLNCVLMTLMCIERHFLVFRPQLYHTHRSRIIFHYTPLVLIISTILIYFVITGIFVSCPQFHYDYSQYMCGYSCAVLKIELGIVYAWVWVFTPTITTVISSILLPIRFVIQKRQLQQVDWHRSRKMILQTSIIAGFYILCWLPYTILLQLLYNDILSFEYRDIEQYLAIVPYITPLLTPFIVLHTVRRPVRIGAIERFKRRLFPQRQALIQPRNPCIVQQQNAITDEKRTLSRCLRIL